MLLWIPPSCICGCALQSVDFSTAPRMWVVLIPWVDGFKTKDRLSGKKPSVSRLQHRKPAWVFGLLACPADSDSNLQHQLLLDFPSCLPFQFWNSQSLHCVNTFLKVNFSLSIPLVLCLQRTLTNTASKPNAAHQNI